MPDQAGVALTDMLRLCIVGRRPPGMSQSSQRAYMKDVHGAAVVRLIAERPEVAPARYVQNHVEAFGVDEVDGIDFVTQVWFAGPEHARAAMTAPEYVDRLQPDEDNFVDRSSVVVLPTRVTVREAVTTDSCAKIVVFSRAPVGSLDEMWARDPGGGARCGLTRSIVVAADAPVRCVDEAWYSSPKAAQVAARAVAAGGATGQFPTPAALPPVLLVREYVLFAGPSWPAP